MDHRPEQRRFAAILAAAGLVAGCAVEGPFPSLAPRAVEFEALDDEAPPPAPLIPSDPATAARIQALVAQARAGEAAFEAEIGTAQRLAAQAGAAGSEGWVAAQQALSRAQGARGATMIALGELDALAVRLAAAKPSASQADIAAALAAIEAVGAIAARQQEAIDAVRSSIRSG